MGPASLLVPIFQQETEGHREGQNVVRGHTAWKEENAGQDSAQSHDSVTPHFLREATLTLDHGLRPRWVCFGLLGCSSRREIEGSDGEKEGFCF